jgi:fructosamine-3-kinase
MPDTPSLDPATATMLLQRAGLHDGPVRALRMMHGGSIYRVFEMHLEGGHTLVAKLGARRRKQAMRREYLGLQFLHEKTRLPGPAPLGLIYDKPVWRGMLLVMQRVPGVNLADARLSPRGVVALQHALAGHVAMLHQRTQDRFGSVAEPEERHERWLDTFGPSLNDEYVATREHYKAPTRDVIDHVIRHLPGYLTNGGPPTLVHGDLWATNIMVDDAHPDRPHITGFIDPAAAWADPEYELAYLRCFQTATPDFFAAYQRHHPLRDGFDRRCRVYWLETMMRHVRVFGERYIRSVESVCEQIRRMR